MHSPKDAAGPSFQPSRRAIHFSFPPTQRFGLLVSSAPRARSRDQRTNLQRSFQTLMDALGTAR